MLLTARALLSVAWPDTADGRYYWEHCLWVDSADWISDAVMANEVIIDLKLLYTNQVKIESIRWYDPVTETVEHSVTPTFPQHGSLIAQTDYNLLICARWRMRGSDGSYSYHLHRQPVGEGYLEGGGWSSLGRVQSGIRMNTFIGQGVYRTSTGALITSGTVSSVPAMWQLRHGTKRKNSHFWL